LRPPRPDLLHLNADPQDAVCADREPGKEHAEDAQGQSGVVGRQDDIDPALCPGRAQHRERGDVEQRKPQGEQVAPGGVDGLAEGQHRLIAFAVDRQDTRVASATAVGGEIAASVNTVVHQDTPVSHNGPGGCDAIARMRRPARGVRLTPVPLSPKLKHGFTWRRVSRVRNLCWSDVLLHCNRQRVQRAPGPSHYSRATINKVENAGITNRLRRKFHLRKNNHVS